MDQRFDRYNWNAFIFLSSDFSIFEAVLKLDQMLGDNLDGWQAAHRIAASLESLTTNQYKASVLWE